MLADLHTHLLPGIDDGAADLKDSLALLNQERACGVDTVVLTPHFKPQVQESGAFFAARARAFELLKSQKEAEGFRFVLGTEVLFSKYLASIENVCDFCIEGTRFMLLELPYHAQFDDAVFSAVRRLCDEHGIVPILAHVERYEAVRRNVHVLEAFREFGALFQVNAATLAAKNLSTRLFVRKLVSGGYLNLVGTDCHDPVHRTADLKRGLDTLEDRFGNRVIREVHACADFVLNNR
ncbi:MAG: hypothetical protein IKT43_04780 [Clostridia bacterium]|nr:hypothetical protein [Clostridia bacterium]